MSTPASESPLLRLADFTPYQLSVTSNAVSRTIADSYEAMFGLKIPEWRLMALLGEHGSATQRDLCRLSEMDKVTVSRAAQALVTRGVIERLPSAEDRRSHALALTRAGRRLYARIVPAALGMEAAVLAVLDPREVAQLKALLARLRDRVDALRVDSNPDAPEAAPESETGVQPAGTSSVVMVPGDR
ncbi:MarR family winged helix-turn-helix transcriptional regulator [Sphingomonas sanxanigenens]|uniref:HTH marR-type domain-containing protein n=1 Tax=Sphingomonas sanxanigenens DSM 19645 = NX02 TaxID=1123269 RepID=W0AJI1_9SPHN|nr:hypothetical protein NX02_25555 [Sphingomonas sanxanigenens DSM 19645 = NX02]